MGELYCARRETRGKFLSLSLFLSLVIANGRMVEKK